MGVTSLNSGTGQEEEGGFVGRAGSSAETEVVFRASELELSEGSFLDQTLVCGGRMGETDSNPLSFIASDLKISFSTGFNVITGLEKSKQTLRMILGYKFLTGPRLA